MVKLNKTRIRWLISQIVRKGRKPSEIAPIFNVSVRRIQQIIKYYREKGMPEPKPWRRPKTYLSDKQKEAIDKAYEETKLSARLLYYELKAKGSYVPKNKLYEHLKKCGYVIPNPNKQKIRKRCRYERKHSGSLLHGDWHRTTLKRPHCILWEDDASRRVLAGGEFKNANSDNSIKTVKQAVEEARDYNLLIKQVNTDRDSCFMSNKKEGTAKFQELLSTLNIDHIPSRVSNPQTNGKLERLWYEYDRHRWRFKTLKQWINWYNNRLHGALNLEWAETPNQAFIRKMPPESLIGLMFNEKTKK